MPELKVKDVKVHYQVYGTGKPIIMIHGFSPDMRLMTGCMEPVFLKREGYKRIYIDLPGMGKTKEYDGVKNSDDMLDIVIEFIDNIIPNESFLVVGESYGGYLAKGIIHKRKKKVDGAAFICPVIIPEVSERTLPDHSIVYKDNEFLEQLDKDEREGFDSVSVIQDEYNFNRFKNEILTGCKIADGQFLAKIKQQYSFTFDAGQDLYELPSVFLLGRQDSMVGFKDALDLIDKFPRATFAILDKAGHNLQIEQKAVFDTHIMDWLARVTEKK
ncbi:alpha/beta hydrolase [Cytobacillus sp. IB215665]|uniref:alpha/beta fold hydrolase n=1 Tax=Cytobacillus sp. IB215665 TaxID=3097357 RepID=UPI002A184CA4|nr:alpha/beta hydrolase [Cytobacillus sp. IB215665]MDX8364701.1 alpha/beta hydrolase [Cytobacillus sp. IB215665]